MTELQRFLNFAVDDRPVNCINIKQESGAQERNGYLCLFIKHILKERAPENVLKEQK
jgi:hypothetical protein